MAKKILIIDDELSFVKVLNAGLSVEGFEVESASNGENGFEKACAVKPDIILLDVIMPGCNGIETANRLKSNPDTADIPVIFITGMDEESISLKYLESRKHHVLLKPFRIEKLISMLKDEFSMAL